MTMSRPSARVWRAPGPRLVLGRPLIQGPFAGVWWIVLLRALLAMALGVLALAWPRHTMVVLVSTFGGYSLLEGALGLAQTALPNAPRARSWSGTAALAGVVAGVAALVRPAQIASVLVMAAGAWLVVRGIAGSCEALASARDRQLQESSVSSPRFTRDELCILVDGLMAGGFGLALVAAPHVGVLGLVWGIGAWALLHGALMLGFALELRKP
jgi:uncharacterized membrane protein HdeD (DUF308 family)